MTSSPRGLERRGRRPVAFLLVLVLALAGCSKVELYGSLNEREANEVLALLLRSGLDVEKLPGKGGISAIRVGGRDVARAMELLNAAGLPRDRFATMGELFRREGLISSPSEERVRYMYGITQELSRTLSGIDGVISARVHVVLPGNDPGAPPARPSSAAVLIRHAPGAVIEAVVPRIKELVVNSIEGMSYDRVSIVLVRATQEEPATATLGGAAEAAPDPLLAPEVVYGLAGGLLASLLGNALLGFLLRRRRKPLKAAAPSSLVPVTP